MTIEVNVFGIAKDILKNDRVAIEIEHSEPTIDTLKQALIERFPGLLQLPSFLFAVNESYADNNQVISDKDDIAIIPPTSGG